VSFWDPPAWAEQQPQPREHLPDPRPPWWGAPSNELGVALPVRLLAGRSERAVVALTHLSVFSSGVAFDLVAMRHPGRVPAEEDEWDVVDPFEPPFGRRFRHRRGSRDVPRSILRFGVEFSDGRKATTLHPWALTLGSPPPVVLQQGGGGGGDTRWHSEFWLWPLPPPGPLAFVVEWPSEQIELTRTEIDAQPILDAAQNVEQLWPESEERNYGTSSWRYGTISTELPDSPGPAG